MRTHRGNARLAQLVGVPLLALVLTAAAHRPPPERVCLDVAQAIEHRQGIPRGLVQAVALAESGRWDASSRRSYAWPWTITSRGDTYYLPDRAHALAKVEELRAAGRRNIDVGCMQINLMWHGDSFASLDEALDPESNITYGAGFLKRLRLDTRSWSTATAHYHSRNPERGNAYRAKVYRLWDDLRAAGRTTAVASDERGVVPPADRPKAGSIRRIGSPRIGPPIGVGAPAPGAIAVLRGW